MEPKKQTGNPSTIPIKLDVLDEKGKVTHTSEYAKDKIVIGRILSADFRIDDARVSRIHALIEIRGTDILLTDLASSHGTFVNGQKVVEKALKFGDVIKIGFIQVKLGKGSGKTIASPVSFEGNPVVDGDETLIDIDRDSLDKSDRRATDRREKNSFPEERRLDDRRGGERRIDQRKKGASGVSDGAAGDRRKSNDERRTPMEGERRVGERRRNDRRVFDITSLERRIDDRRERKNDDDMLPAEMERAFAAPDHARELEITVLWGDHILDVSNYCDPCVLTVGEGPLNHYTIPSVGIPDEFPLVHIAEDGTAHLSFTAQMKGTVRTRDKIYTLAELKEEKFVKSSSSSFSVALKQEDFAKLSIGNINFFILYVRPAPRPLPPPFFERDPLLWRTTIGSAIMFFALLAGLSFIPKPEPMTVEQIPERFVKIKMGVKPKLVSKSGLQAPGEESKQGGSKAGEGGPAIGPEGEAGNKNKPPSQEKAQMILPKSKPPANANISANETKTPDKPTRKVVDKKRAESVGLLRAFSRGDVKSGVNSLIGAGEGKEGPGGFDDFGKSVSGFRGKSLEETGGAGGKGLKGVEAGGGGKTIGIDGPSTKGLGRGYHGDGIGEGISGPGRFGQKGEHAIDIVSENVQVLAGLPKDIINAVINRNRPLIRACYDTALRRNPQLNGKVVMYFDIDKNGRVIRAGVKESTVGDPGLGNCIAERIKGMEFPKPEAPVTTEVTAFPFYLKPAN